ncbi:MAG: hypothetical protein J6U54_15995 [Clostridiales bacterium]|nr:hypothetical protein [Clostridiales bacterium]
MKTVDYAVRIANVAGATPNARRIQFVFGPKCRIPKDAKYVEISLVMGRITFKFINEKPEHSRVGVKRISKLTWKGSSTMPFANISDQKTIKDYEGWEGEYMDVCRYMDDNNIVKNSMFYLKNDMRHAYTNYYKNSSAIVTHKEPDISEEKPVEKKNLGEDLVKATNDVINKITSNFIPTTLAAMTPKPDILPPIEDEEDVLCKAILDEAGICCQNMQAKVSDLLEYRLRKRELSVSEAEGNAEFNKIVVKYIRLYNAIEDLMKNVRHTWGDGRGLYDKYKKTKEDYPNMSDEDVAKFLHVTPEMLLETKEAIERILEDTKDRVKIGFNMEG